MAPTLPLLALLLLGHGSAHPGTWDGKVIMNENGAPLPDLTGRWSTPAGPAYLQLYQPPNEPAAAPNGSYSLSMGQPGTLPPPGVCRLRALYDYASRNRTGTRMHCSHPSLLALAPPREAVVEENSIDWGGKELWTRRPGEPSNLGRLTGVHTVHVIFMNHYDVGYTDFVNGVDNNYMHKYYPSAAGMAAQMRSLGYQKPFEYITHPWLMERFLKCPCSDEGGCPATTLENGYEPPLRCPTQQELANFSAAAARGDIRWNAAPFNVQTEMMAPELFDAGFSLAREMDSRFGREQTRSMSIRDVMYVTRPALPRLARLGVTGLTIGSNGAPVPPEVPKLHRWLDRDSGADIVVAYHPYGYGGYGLKDCAESPNGVALCTEFRTDNTGPPTSVKEVEGVLDRVRHEYPGAHVFPSNFDAFFEAVEPAKMQLPTVELEVSDTWNYGVASDPLKTAQHRALQRLLAECLRDGSCSLKDAAVRNFTFFLLKAPEHTWGTPGISGWGGADDFNVSRFRHNLRTAPYLKAAASWAEQRFFNELAVRALEERGHPLAPKARGAVGAVERVAAPSMRGYVEVPAGSEVRLKNGARLAFGAEGGIARLELGGRDWASAAEPMAAFAYQTFNDSEWAPFTYSYLNDHQMQTGFCKPGSSNFSESRVWRPRVLRTLAKGEEGLLLEMEMPRRAWERYGSWRSVWLEVAAAERGLDLTFTAIGKSPTMVGESTSVTFERSNVPWRVQKLGGTVDPEAVVNGGNQYNHGAWPGVLAGDLEIEMLDSAVVNVVTRDFPVGNALPASYREADAKAGNGTATLKKGSVRGMAAALHNNLWNTNYALFYPYYDARYCASPLDCAYSNASWRFRFKFPRAEEEVLV